MNIQFLYFIVVNGEISNLYILWLGLAQYFKHKISNFGFYQVVCSTQFSDLAPALPSAGHASTHKITIDVLTCH